jgi:hypothetical protein
MYVCMLVGMVVHRRAPSIPERSCGRQANIFLLMCSLCGLIDGMVSAFPDFGPVYAFRFSLCISLMSKEEDSWPGT